MHGVGISFGVDTNGGYTEAEQRKREAQAKEWFSPSPSSSPGTSPGKGPGFIERLFDAFTCSSSEDAYLYNAEAFSAHLRKEEALAAKNALQKPKT